MYNMRNAEDGGDKNSNAEKNSEMHRSVSMPVHPKPLEALPLKRSEEKEVLYERDYYPENPNFDKCHQSQIAVDHPLETKSENKKHNSASFHVNDWTGNTIEPSPSTNPNDQLGVPIKRASRVIEKDGHKNVVFRGVPEKPWRYIRDLITTLVELDWKYMLTMFLGSYFLSWFFFATLCYMGAYSHGDVFFDDVSGERMGEGKEPCIVGVYDFVSILLYSIETQTTIGFGEKYPREKCPQTIFLFIMQIICSIAIEGGMISTVYAKIGRPAKQLTKFKFSTKAVICYRDGQLCLLFRVCDLREQQTIESKIRVYMIIDKLVTREGEHLKVHSELTLEGNGEQLIIWPEIMCHIIDETSLLRYFTNAKQFNTAQCEVYVTMVGTSPATVQITEARTLYVPREIFWGQRFVNIINYDVLNERYVIYYENFNTTISVDMQDFNANNFNEAK